MTDERRHSPADTPPLAATETGRSLQVTGFCKLPYLAALYRAALCGPLA